MFVRLSDDMGVCVCHPLYQIKTYVNILDTLAIVTVYIQDLIFNFIYIHIYIYRLDTRFYSLV